MRWTRRNGETGISRVSYSKREDAEHDAFLCNRVCSEGATYDVVRCMRERYDTELATPGTFCNQDGTKR